MTTCSSTNHERRYLQYVAARVFAEEATEDFTEDELREEAAFRCWLADADVLNWDALPPSLILRALADYYDWQYGECVWWTWPVWSTCERCQPFGTPRCAQCESFTRYCELSAEFQLKFG